MFSAARLVTGARCRASDAGVACGCSSVVRSTSPWVCTQTSALLPPRCIDAICASAPASRARPPGSTRHDCGAVAHREHAQQHRARRDVAGAEVLRPGRHLRQRQVALHRVLVALAHDAAGPFVELAATHAAAQHGVEAGVRIVAGVGGLDRAAVELRQHRFHGGAFAAPPGGQRRQLQLLADQAARQRRQEAEQGGRLEEGRARHVGHQHVAGADRLQQARHAERGIGAQLERVEVLVVQPLDQPVHRRAGPAAS